MSVDIEQNLEQARVLAEAGKAEESRMLLLELLKAQPNNEAALMMLGGAYFAEAKYAEAEMVFERLVLLAPGRGQFSIALFNTLWKQGRNSEALEEIARFIRAADKDQEQATIAQYVAISRQIAANDSRGG